MQEQVNDKTVSLVIRGGKLTGRMLEKALRKLLTEMRKQQQKNRQPKTFQGKQSVKDLVKQGAGVSNIPITDGNIRSFECVARKYGVDYSLMRDRAETPPKWLVFFKAKDTDALMTAFNEFTSKKVKKAEKPSILTALRKNIELVKNRADDKVKHKDKGLEL